MVLIVNAFLHPEGYHNGASWILASRVADILLMGLYFRYRIRLMRRVKSISHY
ncbi:hypothetical protein BD410DRAFT_79423 [Rickenella mellea]|uniref:Uncharacterized protein n=1 Tax=Rickenella mellea TaxID=50990 RepID=A0A4Y7PLQ7_9AGAM|nr:hypothetical protein BD410DRAFT_79423 [Rickenella mellea]